MPPAMRMQAGLGLVACVLATSAWPAAASAPLGPDQRHRGDQAAVMEARKHGRLLSLREIEKRVVASMRGAQYLGFDFDPGSDVYTLKFLRDGAVIWVDVDGRTGEVLRRTGK